MTMPRLAPIALCFALIAASVSRSTANPPAPPPDSQGTAVSADARLFPYRVWTQRWATFAEVSLVARRLGRTLEDYRTELDKHRWMLQMPPALEARPQDWKNAFRFDLDKPLRYSVTDFIADSRGRTPATETRVEVTTKRNVLKVTFHCGEPAITSLIAQSSTPRDEFSRLVLDGSLQELYKLRPSLRRQGIIAKIKDTPPRERSLFEDDCVFIRLTPLITGDDLTREFRVRDQRSPFQLLKQPAASREDALGLRGSFYTLAVNASGSIHTSFFDPTEGGRFWCSWKPHAKTTTQRRQSEWTATIAFPLEHLHPILSRNAVWGIDFYRHRPARGNDPAELVRSRQPSFLHFTGDGRRLETRLRAAGLDEASVSKWSPISERRRSSRPQVEIPQLMAELADDAWPANDQWPDSPTIDALQYLTTGLPSDAKSRIQLLASRRRLFVRFDCQRFGGRTRRTVDRQLELDAFAPGHRAVQWLNRRESFGGPDWGDHIEIQLAPGRGKHDPFHGGYYLILVNTNNQVLTRYVDPSGNYAADSPVWNSAVRTRTRLNGQGWMIDVAIPFATLSIPRQAGRTWHANFMQHTGRDPRSSIAWAATFGAYREPGSMGQLHFQKPPQSPSPFPHWIDGTASDRSARVGNRTLDHSRDCVNDAAWVGDGVVAVGNRGTVWRKSDTAPLEPRQVATDYHLQAVSFVDHRHGWAVGGRLRDAQAAISGGMGTILRTDDSGKSWDVQWEHRGEWLYDVTFVNQRVGFACGGYGVVLKTTDGGKSWHGPLSTGTNAWLYGIFFVDEQTGWVVGQDETLLATRDGGKTWCSQTASSFHRPLDLRDRIRAVHFVTREQGWAVGERGTVLSTTDGGETWLRCNLPVNRELLPLLELRDVCFVNAQTGWLVGMLGSVVWKTTDGGVTWNAHKTGFRGGLCAVTAKDEQTVSAVGERGGLIISADGGCTWTVDAAPQHPTWLYATPHDHHLKGWSGLIAATADRVDWITVRPGRGAFYFEPFLELYPQRWLAGTQACGAVHVREWNDFLNSRRRQPHYVHHAYQLYGGTRPLTLRLTALYRLLRPEVIFCEWPVFAEGYWSWETGLTARCARDAYFASGDPTRFPELERLGLEPWQPAQLFTEARWFNDAFELRPTTHIIHPKNGPSRRSGNRLDAVTQSARSWEGLMDRGFPQVRAWIASRHVHLLHESRTGEGIHRASLKLDVQQPMATH